MDIGFQLFGIMSTVKGDILDLLRELQTRGVRFIEPCVSLDPIPGMERVIWPADWLAEQIGAIHALGLSVRSAHLFSKNPDPARLIELSKATGITHYVLSSPQELTPAALQQAALNIMALADALEPEGITLLLHNQDRDIAAKVEGVSAYERLLDLCMGRLSAQVDVGWVYYGGEDPVDFLRRNADRVASIHYKDFPAESSERVDLPVGTGAVDLEACFRFARARAIPQIIDQDRFSDLGAEVSAGLALLRGFANSREHTRSFLNTCDIVTGEVRTLAAFDKIIEAPNWMKTQNALLYNAEGRIYTYDLGTGAETLIDTGSCTACNNDHVLSPDETLLAVSDMSPVAGERFSSHVYLLPIGGGEPRRVTEKSPSFLHGWSPDGKTLAYTAFRPGEEGLAIDICTLPVEGGEETRLTGGGYNDGSEYSPDGKTIWFNSTRSGLMQVWRMNADGSNQTQVTANCRNNWFPHISPDGQKVVYISYAEGALEPAEHLPNLPVELWLMNADGTGQRRILSLFGGQGSMNVNPWAGDSRHFAFVSYEETRDV